MINDGQLKIKTKHINTVFKNKYIELQNNDVVFPDNNTGKHIKIIENNSTTPGIVIICENSKKELLFVELYRYGIGDYSLELPRGYKKEKEAFIDAGIREIREEVNINRTDIINVSLKGTFYTNTAHTASEVGVVFITVDSKNLEIELEKKESIFNYKWLTPNKIKDGIKKGLIKDSFSINSFMLHSL